MNITSSSLARLLSNTNALKILFIAAAFCLAALFLALLANLLPASRGLSLVLVLALAAAVFTMWRKTPHGTSRPARLVAQDTAPPDQNPFQIHGGTMIELMPEPVILLDDTARIYAANMSARRRFSLSGEQVLLSSVLREPDVLNAVFACARGGTSRTVRFMTLTPHEEHVRVYVSTVAEHLASDARTQPERLIMLSFADETALRRAERLRLDFLANASHELRTPLTALAGFIETLRGHARDDADARDHFLGIMHKQTARMRRLINDLLSLSRVELYEHVAPHERVNLADIATELANTLAPLAQDAGVQLILEDTPNMPAVLGVRDELIQVSQNLIENAIKYSSKGHAVRVRVGASPDRASVEHDDLAVATEESRFAILPPPMGENGFGWISVADSGPGIPRRHLPRLGERFFRADPDSPQAKRGTGLGLAITKHILNRHRGGLLVASVEGAGTSFTMLAPLAEEIAHPAATPPTARAPADTDIGALQIDAPADTPLATSGD